MIVVDTSVWIDAFRGKGTSQTDELRAMIEAGESLAITDLILTELLQGARHEKEARRIEDALVAYATLRLDSLDDFRRAASLYRTARHKGVTIRRTSDCLIASVCVRDDVPLLHADVDFDRLASCTALRIVPTEA